MDYFLSVSNIKKIYETSRGEVLAIKDVSLDIDEGEIIGIVGKSGCGKSTLLNIISGLDTPSSGKITFRDNDVRIAYMFQEDALLPWRNVLDNACLPLEIRGEKTKDEIARVKDLLSQYGLSDFLDKRPNNLSGGMRQRVALVRSLAIKPDILLLDEPFSALDYYTRYSISNDIYKMIKSMNMTTIIITHDIQEALSLADRVILMSDRPSTIKAIYDVPFKDIDGIIERRKDPSFMEMYETIWRDLDGGA